jgi:hypothetical protein
VNSSGDITQLLSKWANGNHDALDSLAPLVQAELRRIADAYLRREHAGHTLQPTALVNEPWLRLVKQDQPEFESRRRFYALAAQMMRQILIDYARSARAGKRGGGEFAIALPHSLSGGDTGDRGAVRRYRGSRSGQSHRGGNLHLASAKNRRGLGRSDGIRGHGPRIRSARREEKRGLLAAKKRGGWREMKIPAALDTQCAAQLAAVEKLLKRSR